MHGARTLSAWRSAYVPVVSRVLVLAWLVTFTKTFFELPISQLLYPPGQEPVSVAINSWVSNYHYDIGTAMTVLALLLGVRRDRPRLGRLPPSRPPRMATGGVALAWLSYRLPAPDQRSACAALGRGKVSTVVGRDQVLRGQTGPLGRDTSTSTRAPSWSCSGRRGRARPPCCGARRGSSA